MTNEQLAREDRKAAYATEWPWLAALFGIGIIALIILVGAH